MHTPEPWVSCVNGLDGILTIEQDGQVYDEPIIVVDCVADMGDGIDRLTGEANAKRIVDCVNGCAGINPEAVKDLLAACEQALKLIGTDSESSNGCGSPEEVASDLRAAIIKAEQK